ncbi:MAG: YggS family pyridoxal phosphate-dependent enzyme [Sulfuritalea sp.]|nr:YggS family pyridoxal phosphate-dependent enzyme [Sulfuritalea sp.]
MTSIAANLQAVRARIAAACVAAGRPTESVQLLAVSKTWPAASLREATAAGQRAFGENYLQEAAEKAAQLADLDLEWHFIGPLQSNKTRPVAEGFAWVHSVDRLKIAERLAAQRPAALPPLNVCLQVNVSGEASKSGCAPEQGIDLAAAIGTLPRLCLCGLMAIPEPTTDVALQRRQFALLRRTLERINAELDFRLDTLSMGMSDDLEAAIMEGATMVRVGTAIFGQRD